MLELPLRNHGVRAFTLGATVSSEAPPSPSSSSSTELRFLLTLQTPHLLVSDAARATFVTGPAVELSYRGETLRGVGAKGTVALEGTVLGPASFASVASDSVVFTTSSKFDGHLGLAPADGAVSLGDAAEPAELLAQAFPPALFSLYLTPDADEDGSFVSFGAADLDGALQRSRTRYGTLDPATKTLRWAPVLPSPAGTPWRVAVKGFGTLDGADLVRNYCASSGTGCSAVFEAAAPTLSVPHHFYSSFVRSLVYDAEASCYYQGGRLLCDSCEAVQFPTLGLKLPWESEHGTYRGVQLFQLQPADYLIDAGRFRCEVLISESPEESGDLFTLGTAFLKTHYTIYDATQNRVGLACLDAYGRCSGGLGSFSAASGTRYCLLQSNVNEVCFESRGIYYFFLVAGLTFALVGIASLLQACYRSVRETLASFRSRKAQIMRCAPAPETVGLTGGDHPDDVDFGDDNDLGIALL